MMEAANAVTAENQPMDRNSIRRVDIEASGSYPVWIGRNLLGKVGELVRMEKQPCKAAIISDFTTGGLFENRIEKSLTNAGFTVVKTSIPVGEESKNLEQLGKTLRFLSENGLDRSDLVIALGGGVVGDLTGFASAVYLRGIDYVQIPTTFLAAIDSSVGGKTAVDLPTGKNLAGAFHQPLAVICDCDAFQTLRPETFADGAAEAVKYGVLAGGQIFESLAEGRGGAPGLPDDLIPQVVEQCVAVKAGIVGRDEFDRGERQLLNLGHTIGHAIERCSAYRVTHGRAVAIGTAIMARAAERAGLAEPGCASAVEAVLCVQGLPIETEFSADELFEAAAADKKRAGDTIQIIVPQRVGCCVIRKVPMAELRSLIALGLQAEGSVTHEKTVRPDEADAEAAGRAFRTETTVPLGETGQAAEQKQAAEEQKQGAEQKQAAGGLLSCV